MRNREITMIVKLGFRTELAIRETVHDLKNAIAAFEKKYNKTLKEFRKSYSLKVIDSDPKLMDDYEEWSDAVQMINQYERTGEMPQTVISMAMSELKPMNMKELRQILTEKRIELLQKARELKTKSISELANKLDRDISSISDDLDILERYGLVSLKRMPSGKIVEPRVEEVSIRI